MRTCTPARASASVLIRSGRSASWLHLPMPEAAVTAAWYRRLMLALLLAPALLGLLALIILPHLDLALLSLRVRVAPRQYVFSLAQYRTFFTEPLYWHV